MGAPPIVGNMPAALRVASVAVILPLIMSIMGAGGTNSPVAARPAVGETVGEAPSSVTMAMRTKVAGPAVIIVKDSSGKVVSEPDTIQLSTNISADLKFGLTPGTYTVSYRIEGSRGPEGGSYQFIYRSGTITQKGIRTWTGYRQIPEEVSLPDDKQREQAFKASATKSPGGSDGTPSDTPSPTTGVPETPSPDASTAARDSNGGGGVPWFWILGGVLVLGLATAVVLRKRPSTSHPGDD